MFYPFRNFAGDRKILTTLTVIVGLLIVLWISTMLFARPQETQFLLHYAVDFGVNFVGPWHYVYRIPILGTVIALINCFLAYLLFRIEKKYTYLLLASAIAVLLLLLFALIIIILLNI